MKKQAITLLLILSGFANNYAQSYPEMITVEGGTFTMGDTEMVGEANEQPTHQVTLKTFKIAKTETTVEQWRVFCTATGRSMPETPSWGWIDNHPIVNVSYNDAGEYCYWLCEKMDPNYLSKIWEKKEITNYYRLPTEAEWEYAARGGKLSKGTKYSGGRSLNDVGWYEANSNSKTNCVATAKPNELGIYDMSGNVWELCEDWYDAYDSQPQTNPKGGASGYEIVLRGGGWDIWARFCRVAFRGISQTKYRSDRNGFRVVLSQ